MARSNNPVCPNVSRAHQQLESRLRSIGDLASATQEYARDARYHLAAAESHLPTSLPSSAEDKKKIADLERRVASLIAEAKRQKARADKAECLLEPATNKILRLESMVSTWKSCADQLQEKVNRSRLSFEKNAHDREAFWAALRKIAGCYCWRAGYSSNEGDVTGWFSIPGRDNRAIIVDALVTVNALPKEGPAK